MRTVQGSSWTGGLRGEGCPSGPQFSLSVWAPQGLSSIWQKKERWSQRWRGAKDGGSQVWSPAQLTEETLSHITVTLEQREFLRRE